MTIESIWRDQVHGFRTLRKSPGFTLTVIVILAVGIGANTAVFSVVDAAFLRRLPYPAPDRLVMLPATHHPDIFGATALVLVAAALAASLAPAIRATRVDPTEALRMR